MSGKTPSKSDNCQNIFDKKRGEYICSSEMSVECWDRLKSSALSERANSKCDFLTNIFGMRQEARITLSLSELTHEIDMLRFLSFILVCFFYYIYHKWDLNIN